MKRPTQVRLMQQLLGQVQGNATVDAGCVRSAPMSMYTCTDLALQEWQEFYCQIPMLVCLSNHLATAGSAISNCSFGVHVLLTRNGHGELQAFKARCNEYPLAHRSCQGGFSSSSALEAGLDQNTDDLESLPCLEQYGMVWVHPRPDGEINVDELLGKLAGELESWRLERFILRDSKTIKARMNWKLANDSYGEAYHLDVLHKRTMGTFFIGNASCFEALGDNHRLVLCRREIEKFLELPEKRWNIRRGALTVYYLFPNIQLMVAEDGVHLLQIYPDPGDPGKSVTHHSFYIDPLLELAPDQAIKASLHGFRHVIEKEDYPCMETIQRNAAVNPLARVIFGRNEPALHHYHCSYGKRLNRNLLRVE